MIEIRKYKLVSEQVTFDEVRIIIDQLARVLARNVSGDIVELGCYEGTTSLFITRELLAHKSDRLFHVYDSFAGLPEKTAPDNSPVGEQFKGGELYASKARFIQHFKQAGLPLPVIHKCWFDELQPSDLPARIAFAFLDGDFYESIKASLRLIENRMAPGSVIIIDDYQSEALPGARKATDEWLRTKNYTHRSECSLAIIYC